MLPFTPGELQALEDTSLASMQDTCQLLTYTEGVTDAYGKPTITYTPGASLACGYNATRQVEVMEGTEVAITDATLRLPAGTSIDHRDRVKITHRLGVALAAQPVYSFIGEARQGHSALVAGLRLVV